MSGVGLAVGCLAHLVTSIGSVAVLACWCGWCVTQSMQVCSRRRAHPFVNGGHCTFVLLQVLQEVHTTLFTLLGKTSAQNVDKMAALAEQYPAPLITRYGHTVLSGACAA